MNVRTSEGVPVAIMEAMSYGISVMQQIGGTNEIVSSNAGMLLPKDLTAKMQAEKIWKETI